MFDVILQIECSGSSSSGSQERVEYRGLGEVAEVCALILIRCAVSFVVVDLYLSVYLISGIEVRNELSKRSVYNCLALVDESIAAKLKSKVIGNKEDDICLSSF